jgi:hypothetical protein
MEGRSHRIKGKCPRMRTIEMETSGYERYKMEGKKRMGGNGVEACLLVIHIKLKIQKR